MATLSELKQQGINFTFEDGGSNPITVSELKLKNIPFELGEKGGRFKDTSFLERLKLGFGSKEAKAKQQAIEKAKGLKGKLDLGDIADITGISLPIIGGILGGIFGALPGSAIGTSAGEGIRRIIGQALGVREEISPIEEGLGTAGAGAIELAGGKVLGLLGRKVAKPVLNKAFELSQGSKNFFISRVPKLLSIITAEGDDAVRAALKDPIGADKAIAGGDKALREALQEAANKSIQIRTGFIRGHSESINKFSQSLDPNLQYDKKQIVKLFEDLLKDKGVIGKKGVLDFTKSGISANPGEMTKINQAITATNAWDDFSFEGVNELKRLIQALTRFPDDAGFASKSPTLGIYQRQINNLIKSKLLPEQKKALEIINANFAQNIDLFDDMVEAFNKGDSFSRIANVFGKNKDALRQVINFFEKQSGQNIQSVVAGRQLAIEKSAPFGFLNPRSWIDLIFPPEAQAKLVTEIGKKFPDLVK